MSDAPRLGLKKIHSEDLRREAAAAESEPHVVIVELDLPQPRIDVASGLEGPVFGRPKIRMTSGPDDSAARDRRVAEARQAIGDILGRAPDSYLSTSGTFVLEANGEQLRDIAELKEVSAIWPNTRRDGFAL